MAKQTKITKAAKGQQCTARIPGICNFNTETTVFAHLNGGGMGMKQSDLHGAFCCSDCHYWLDSDYVRHTTREERDLRHYEAMIITQKILLKNGLIKLS